MTLPISSSVFVQEISEDYVSPSIGYSDNVEDLLEWVKAKCHQACEEHLFKPNTEQVISSLKSQIEYIVRQIYDHGSYVADRDGDPICDLNDVEVYIDAGNKSADVTIDGTEEYWERKTEKLLANIDKLTSTLQTNETMGLPESSL